MVPGEEMLFHEVALKGVYVISLQPVEDERGFFARTWCRATFQELGLNADLAQCSMSYTRRRGTIRGMHYQTRPHEEVKLIHCVRGAIHDVIIDLRPFSPTYLKWAAFQLTAE